MATTPNLTDEQRANLAKLAAYLRTLPPEYPDFAMDDFTAADGSPFVSVPECGTAACAAGHGPLAGIAFLQGETWYDYSCRAFAGDSGWLSPWDWCFSATWANEDNTAHGAASRIEYMLEYGIPDDGFEQMCGDAALSYSTVATQ